MAKHQALLLGDSIPGGDKSTGGPSIPGNNIHGYGTSKEPLWWNNAANYGSNGTAYVQPQSGSNPFRSAGYNNSSPWAANVYYDNHSAESDYKVFRGFINCKDGAPIQNFLEGGAGYNELYSIMTAAGIGSFKSITVCLGTNNRPGLINGMTPEQFAVAYGEMHQWLRTLCATGPINCCGLPNSLDADNDAVIQQFVADRAAAEAINYIPMSGLETVDGTHLSGVGQRDFGYRWGAYL